MQVDRSSADGVSEGELQRPDGAGKSEPQVVDWFGLTESNLPPKPVAPAAPATVELQGPTLSSIGGLRP
jgi:hypothetical protein